MSALIVILAIALAVIAIVAVGMQGNLADRAPEIAHVMANTARVHRSRIVQVLLVEFFDEIPVPKSADSATEAARR